MKLMKPMIAIMMVTAASAHCYQTRRFNDVILPTGSIWSYLRDQPKLETTFGRGFFTVLPSEPEFCLSSEFETFNISLVTTINRVYSPYSYQILDIRPLYHEKVYTPASYTITNCRGFLSMTCDVDWQWNLEKFSECSPNTTTIVISDEPGDYGVLFNPFKSELWVNSYPKKKVITTCAQNYTVGVNYKVATADVKYCWAANLSISSWRKEYKRCNSGNTLEWLASAEDDHIITLKIESMPSNINKNYDLLVTDNTARVRPMDWIDHDLLTLGGVSDVTVPAALVKLKLMLSDAGKKLERERKPLQQLNLLESPMREWDADTATETLNDLTPVTVSLGMPLVKELNQLDVRYPGAITKLNCPTTVQSNALAVMCNYTCNSTGDIDNRICYNQMQFYCHPGSQTQRYFVEFDLLESKLTICAKVLGNCVCNSVHRLEADAEPENGTTPNLPIPDLGNLRAIEDGVDGLLKSTGRMYLLGATSVITSIAYPITGKALLAICNVISCAVLIVSYYTNSVIWVFVALIATVTTTTAVFQIDNRCWQKCKPRTSRERAKHVESIGRVEARAPDVEMAMKVYKEEPAEF